MVGGVHGRVHEPSTAVRAASIVCVTTCCCPYAAEDHAFVRNRAGQGRSGAEEKLCHTCFSPSALILSFFKKNQNGGTTNLAIMPPTASTVVSQSQQLGFGLLRGVPPHPQPIRTGRLQKLTFSILLSLFSFFQRCNYTAASPIR